MKEVLFVEYDEVFYMKHYLLNMVNYFLNMLHYYLNNDNDVYNIMIVIYIA